MPKYKYKRFLSGTLKITYLVYLIFTVFKIDMYQVVKIVKGMAVDSKKKPNIS